MSTKPDLFELEALRTEIIEKSNNTSSNSLKIFLYYNYFDKVLTTNNPNFTEAFLKEFIDDYVHSISKFEVLGTNPEFTKKIITHLKILNSLSISAENIAVIKSEIERIEKQFEKLNLILSGKDYKDGIEHKAFFPLIDKEAPAEFYGIIDSVTIRISKNTDADKFIIVPSEKEIEIKINDQCKGSWSVALGLSKNYIKKTYQYHEVIISFDKRVGFYEGNSLGIALTLSFLEQLLKFYNPAYIINIKEHSAFTGGVDNNGNILVTGEEIIKQKVNAIFFSEINSFVIPKCEETYAYFALTQLEKDYPDRNLKLIPVEDINDVINRRDLVDIKKQKLAVRTGKFVKKNWISAVATVLLAMLFGYLFVVDWDDNPALLESHGTTLFVKNKNGKLLWSKYLSIETELVANNNYLSKYCRIIDIDNDGTNELIICAERDKKTRQLLGSALATCYNYKGESIWNYQFKDRVISDREILNTEYGSISILDTLTFTGNKSILLSSSNGPSFSSAIYRLNLVTGKRLPGTFWASGHIMDGIVKDIDKDNKLDIVGAGYENGYEDLVFFAYEIDTLTKVRPTKEEYLIRDFPIAEMKSYIRFPKTDFDNYDGTNRTPGYGLGGFIDNKNYKKITFSSSIPKNIEESEVGYEVAYNFKDINIVIGSSFRVQRDTLVAHGKLNLPYTDTEEYKEVIKNNILYWKDGKWVKRNELNE